MPAASSALPVATTTLEPALSSTLPATGEPTAIASTTGTSMKLAVDSLTLNAALSSLGTNTTAASPSPAPTENAAASATCLDLNSPTRSTGSADLLSRNQKIGRHT